MEEFPQASFDICTSRADDIWNAWGVCLAAQLSRLFWTLRLLATLYKYICRKSGENTSWMEGKILFAHLKGITDARDMMKTLPLVWRCIYHSWLKFGENFTEKINCVYSWLKYMNPAFLFVIGEVCRQLFNAFITQTKSVHIQQQLGCFSNNWHVIMCPSTSRLL